VSVKQAATSLIKDGRYDQGILNKVEMAVRAYTPECPVQLIAWMAVFTCLLTLWTRRETLLKPSGTEISLILTPFSLESAAAGAALLLDGSLFFSYQKLCGVCRLPYQSYRKLMPGPLSASGDMT
jgi:hypothetical protein